MEQKQDTNVIGRPPEPATRRRSNRIAKQAKPTPSLLAAKKNAMKTAKKKQPEFSFIKDIYQIARDAKERLPKGTGLVYDNKMTQHECPWDPNYPENPQRLTAVFDRCKELGLVDKCRAITPVSASEAQILSVHNQRHLSLLKSLHGETNLYKLEHVSSNYDAIYINPSTYECSMFAAGCAIQLVDEICKQNIQNGMALIRPPGHHAMEGEYNGYCFFNNVAIAAKHVLGLGLKKILILDWDVHHGQGTQRAFYRDPRVLYISIHRYEHGTFWPNLRESEFDFVGEGPGQGYNMNIPLNSTGMTDADYLAVFHNVIMKVAYQFQPAFVIVSSGYDSAVGCPEGNMDISPACYAHMLTCLKSLANGNVAVMLEGGYCLKSLAEGAAATLRALLGEPCPVLQNLQPISPSMEETILSVISVHKRYWNCLDCLGLYTMSGGCMKVKCVDEEELLWDYGQKITFHKTQPRYDFKNEMHIAQKYATRDCYPVQSKSEMEYFNTKIDNLISSTRLCTPPNRVCFVYETKMMDHKNLEEVDHIEKPQRIATIYQMFEDYDLLDRLFVLKGRSASEAEVKYAHSDAHVAQIKEMKELSVEELKKKRELYQSVYFHPESFAAASLAAGCLLQVVDSVLMGESQTGVAVVRPPGHHADTDDPCGFCIFNSVAIAARHATTFHKLSRVLIVDWDVHHGNGTQEIFYEDPCVLYISVHRFDRQEFFPSTGEGGATLTGRGPGVGFNVNIPWNQSGMGNAEYVAAFHQIILPIAYQFDPQLVLVSAGFDAAVGDPLGGCKVTPEAFGHMTHWLMPLAGGRVILSLEGGYNVNSTAYSMTMCTKTLLGDPLPILRDAGAPCASALKSLREVAFVQADHWPCLKLNKVKIGDNFEENGSRAPKNEDGISSIMALLEVKDNDGQGGKEIDGDKTKESNSGAGETNAGASGSNDPSPQQSSSDQSRPSTLQAYLTANLEALQNQEMFAVIPLRTCPHLPEVRPVPPSGINSTLPCSDCGDITENWICLTCYLVKCGRFVHEHMMLHNLEISHPLTLSFSDLSVWCYPCQSYIDNPVLFEAKNALHVDKFGLEMAWSYGEDRHPTAAPT